MNQDLTKAQRRRIRDLGGIAYERDLSEHLGALESEFNRWRAGEIDAFAVSESIHRFHQGPARELFSIYAATSDPQFAVAHAIHRGLLRRDEVGAEVLEILGKHLGVLGEQDGT
jgi:hypothetical protein